MKDNYKEKTLLITGGTGSFGNQMAKYFISRGCKEVRIFSRDEKKQDDMRKFYNEPKLKFYLGDVRDKESLREAFKNVNYVFHAAALKQVPSCEFYPMEAIKTNILGAENVLSSACENNIEVCVVLSTDKAVYPINTMGMTKALMEKVMVAKSRVAPKGTVLCGTRYGNVMGSRGSVIPLFKKQILDSKNVTVTDGSMTRFLMSLDESVSLVDYAFNNAKNGDIFVQKSPASTIGDLAEAMIQYYKSSSKIDIIGVRHGEKFYEVLVNKEEMSKAEDCGDYYRIPSDSRDLNYKTLELGSQEILSFTEYNSNNTTRLNKIEIINLLKKTNLL
jgi:UDP-N-acetylglucosamine 4,6-dehydratase/5-epimerase